MHPEILTRDPETLRHKKAPYYKTRRLMFAQRNNPYCDLLHFKDIKYFITP